MVIVIVIVIEVASVIAIVVKIVVVARALKIIRCILSKDRRSLTSAFVRFLMPTVAFARSLGLAALAHSHFGSVLCMSLGHEQR